MPSTSGDAFQKNAEKQPSSSVDILKVQEEQQLSSLSIENTVPPAMPNTVALLVSTPPQDVLVCSASYVCKENFLPPAICQLSEDDYCLINKEIPSVGLVLLIAQDLFHSPYTLEFFV